MKLSIAALADLKSFGLSVDDVLGMVRKSARVTHPDGNRRYHEWVFQVEKDVIRFVSKLEPEVIVERQAPKVGPNEFLVWEVCDHCDGERCEKCDFQGEIACIHKLPPAKSW